MEPSCGQEAESTANRNRKGCSWYGLWCQGLSMKVLVAKCQGFWNRGDGRVVQNSCRWHFMMVLDHHKQPGRALFPSFWKIWWFGYSYGQYHPTVGNTVNDCIRRPEYKASYTRRIANLPINIQWIANLPINIYAMNCQLANELPTCQRIFKICNELPTCH